MDEKITKFIELIMQNEGFDELKELELEIEKLNQKFDENVLEFNDLRNNRLT